MTHTNEPPGFPGRFTLEHGSEIVESVQRRCRNALRDFLKSLQPPPPPPRAGLDWLGRLLGQILTPRDRAAPTPPDGDRGIVSIHTVLDPHAEAVDNGLVCVKASYSVGLKPEYESGLAKVRFNPRVQFLEGDAGSRGESLGTSIVVSGVEVAAGANAFVDVEIEQGQRVQIDVTSDPYTADWAVGLHIEASVVGVDAA